MLGPQEAPRPRRYLGYTGQHPTDLTGQQTPQVPPSAQAPCCRRGEQSRGSAGALWGPVCEELLAAEDVVQLPGSQAGRDASPAGVFGDGSLGASQGGVGPTVSPFLQLTISAWAAPP